MSDHTLRAARRARGWTQGDLARRLGVSQTYVSLFESGARPVPPGVAKKLVAALSLPATAVPVTAHRSPLSADAAVQALGSMGYPGFAHLGTRKAILNPAELVLRVLASRTVEARVVEALPWVLLLHPELDWDWLVTAAKVGDLQNRLGFVVTLARTLAEQRGQRAEARILAHWEQVLTYSRLQREDAFASDTMTASERRWLATHRSAEAAHWNLLSNITAEALTSA